LQARKKDGVVGLHMQSGKCMQFVIGLSTPLLEEPVGPFDRSVGVEDVVFLAETEGVPFIPTDGLVGTTDAVGALEVVVVGIAADLTRSATPHDL
jgi:hypothetical protein